MVEGSIGIAQLPRQGISQVNGVVLPTETWGRFKSPSYGKFHGKNMENTGTYWNILQHIGKLWENDGNITGTWWDASDTSVFLKSHAGWNGVPNMETSSMRKSWLLVMKQQVAGYSLGAQGTIHRWWLSHLPLNIWNHDGHLWCFSCLFDVARDLYAQISTATKVSVSVRTKTSNIV